MNAILLDTCALLWLGLGDDHLSLEARQLIEETETVFVSPISLWEISNKVHQGKLTLKLPVREWFRRACERYRLSLLPLTSEAMFSAGELPAIHKDPADRMIIASALERQLPVVTGDHNFPLYGVKTVC
jgi:PIN domain nuclease of toxin-antitoxin system